MSQLQPGYSLDAVVEAKLAENSFILRAVKFSALNLAKNVVNKR